MTRSQFVAIDRWLPLGLALYFGIHLVARVLVSPSLELDEAEQLLQLQAVSLGYGLQPPLYTWLQALVFLATGPGVLGLALLKAVLLWLTWWAVFRAARLFYQAKDALAIGLSLALFPQFLWESQRDLTHTVLLVACVALTWLLLLGCRGPSSRDPTIPCRFPRSTWRLALLLGFLAGAAILAKYSAGLWLAILVVSVGVAGGPLRHWLGWRPLVLAVIIALLVLLPHGAWLFYNLDQVVEPIQAKLGIPSTTRDVKAEALDVGFGVAAVNAWKPGAALGSLLQALGSFIGVWLLVTSLALGWHWFRQGTRLQAFATTQGGLSDLTHGGTPHTVAQQSVSTRVRESSAAGISDVPVAFWKAYLTLFITALLGMIFLGDVTQFKDRWMQPFLVILPLAFAQIMFKDGLPSVIRRLWIASALSLMFLTLVLMPFRTFSGGHIGALSRLAIPYEKLAQSLHQDYPGLQAIVAPQGLVAGNLALYSQSNNWRVGRQWLDEGTSLWVIQETPTAGASWLVPEGWMELGVYTFSLRYNQTVKEVEKAIWRVYGPPNPDW